MVPCPGDSREHTGSRHDPLEIGTRWDLKTDDHGSSWIASQIDVRTLDSLGSSVGGSESCFFPELLPKLRRVLRARVRVLLSVEVDLGVELLINWDFWKHLKLPQGAQK